MTSDSKLDEHNGTYSDIVITLHYITFIHLADALIQSDFQERASQSA